MFYGTQYWTRKKSKMWFVSRDEHCIWCFYLSGLWIGFPWRWCGVRSDIGRTFTNFYSSFKSFFLFTESPRSNSLLECPMSIYEVLKNEIIILWGMVPFGLVGMACIFRTKFFASSEVLRYSIVENEMLYCSHSFVTTRHAIQHTDADDAAKISLLPLTVSKRMLISKMSSSAVHIN